MNLLNNILTCVGEKLSHFPAFVFLIGCFCGADAAISEPTPDFAFPSQVETRSEKILSDALATGAQLKALRSVMDICVARSLSNDNYLCENLSLLDSIADKLSCEYRDLTFLLKAQVIYGVYSSNPGLYQSRNLPSDMEMSVDPTRWSADMFKIKMLQTIDSATLNLASLQPCNIKEISSLLSNTETAQKINMTVPDFIALKSVELLTHFSSGQAAQIIPFNDFVRHNSLEAQCEQRIDTLLNLVIERLASTNPCIKALAYIKLAQMQGDGRKEFYLIDALTDLKGTEGEGIILYELWNGYGKTDNQYYPEICEWLKQYPNGFGHEQLEHAKTEMEQQRIQISFPKVCLPHCPLYGEATVKNLQKGYLLIYPVDNNQVTVYDELIVKNFTPSAKPVKILELGEEGSVPYSYTRTVEIDGLTEGVYALIPSLDKTLPKNWSKKSQLGCNYATLRVTDISILSSFDSNEKNSGRVYVVKGSNQQPVEGASVAYYNGGSKTPKAKEITNKEGWVEIPAGYYRIEAQYGKSMARREAGFSYYPENFKETPRASIITDLGVYRPLDTIQFAIVGWKQEKYTNSILPETKVKVTFHDANYSEIGDTLLILDKNGRANGKFIVPSGHLLGNYHLTATYPNFAQTSVGEVAVKVEEYKVPEFMVTLEQISSPPDVVVFEGFARSYTGMPVPNSPVNVEVVYQTLNWGVFSGTNASYSETLTTDSNGNFSIELPLAPLMETRFEKGRFSITAQVTSPSGDTQKSRPCYFTLGSGFEIRPIIADKVQITNDSISLNIPVYDNDGLPVTDEVEYKIINTTTGEEITGRFQSPELVLSSNIIPSGQYRLEFNLDDSDTVMTQTVFWRKDDRKTPYPTSLWIPENEYTYSTGQNNVKVSFGSYYPNWLLAVLSDGQKVINYQWIEPQDTMIDLTVDIPEDNPFLFLTLSGMHDFQTSTGVIKIIPAKSLEKMSIKSTTFRDRIYAGENEEWKFTFNIGDLPSPFVNAFAVMTDKALNEIYEFEWDLNIFRPTPYCRFNLNAPGVRNVSSYANFTTIKYPAKYSYFILPDWNTYGYPLIMNGGRNGGPVLYRSLAMKNAMIDMAADQEVAEEAVENGLTTTGNLNENPKKDKAGNLISNEEPLRPSELPLAFFMPDLKANEEGEVIVKFQVPNFNTTWQFQLLGYNEEMLTSSLVMNTMAAKEVMVKSNLPQFLRTGDKAEISAMIYNNTSNPLPVAGLIEVLKSGTGEILSHKNFESEILQPSDSKVITIQFDVPDIIDGLIIRSYAFSDNHSDGEQGFVSILPSVSPVTEATTFYLGSADENVEIKIPKLSRNSNVTLKYCDNPLWEVLLSLPSFSSSDPVSSIGIANRLFAMLTAQGIIYGDQQIYNGLKNILTSEDSTLTMSGLEKDSGLKIVDLQASPWLNSAYSETDRIRNLSQYLDRKKTEENVSSAIIALRDLQNSDGGFSWCPGMKSSDYITGEIVSVLGYLKQNNLIDSRLVPILRKAVKYCDNRIVNNYKEDRGFNTRSLMKFFYARQNSGEGMSANLKKIKGECYDSIVNQWPHWDCGQKAMGALVLLDSDKFKEQARTIALSLEEFLGKHCDLYQEALMLQLFEKIEPGSKNGEQISQSMLLQKETMNWGLDPGAIPAIHMLLKTVSDRAVESVPEIWIGDKKLDLPHSQKLVGNYTINLDASTDSGKKLHINREGGVPAWGGIVVQTIEPIKDVKKESVENLSVEKKIYLKDSSGQKRKSKEFMIGDKVSVILEISCDKEMDYITLVDSRPACFQTDDKISCFTIMEGLPVYREIRFDKTTFFIEHLPVGKYVIKYDCNIDREGEYSVGIAEIQSMYTPQQVAHSSGSVLKIVP